MTGWVAALAALLAAAVLFADRPTVVPALPPAPPPVDPAAGLASLPADARAAAPLAGLRSADVTTYVSDGCPTDPKEVRKRVAAVLADNGIPLGTTPAPLTGPDGELVVRISLTPVESADRSFLLQVEATLYREVIIGGRRVFAPVWMLIRPASGDAVGVTEGAYELAAAHARQFAEHVRSAGSDSAEAATIRSRGDILPSSCSFGAVGSYLPAGGSRSLPSVSQSSVNRASVSRA